MKKSLHAIVLLFLITTAFPLASGCKEDKNITPRPKVEAKEETGLITLSNTNIHVMGARYVSRTPAKLSFTRFSGQTLALPSEVRRFSTTYALATTGISLQFKTRSSSIHLTFSRESGMNDSGSFQVLRDGVNFKTVEFVGAVNTPMQIELNALPTDKEYVYEVILPCYTNVSLTKLELDGESSLVTYVPTPKGIYISFGDSITHGAGQGGATYLTYPFLLAQKLDMSLYNLAISGAKISIPMAETAKELPQADIITVLIGYNDFSSGNRTATEIDNDYRLFLTEIRNNQPSAEIYCITALYTTNTSNATTGMTAEELRDVVKDIVTEYQATDNKLHLIEGDKIITSSAQLADRVHLNVIGASTLANGLYEKITDTE
ncbi:SGNH/GDSL hydrolase family protein [Sphingobacterium sp. SGG-5]|uniref:SGNH/GDSL hydrolase family protein n=1 Tax=Sphingobacterium sp. SGG-5 TaxID=2710881 RepID=UPI0013EB7205|nr:SGNH/GDSL hydrolase family protein [Sphingobacterium sp. SGG-5]NGM60861.1 SGNH/GDSL hydrolase family protein [Sphingobacterium sp. SGG-5]